MRKTTLVTLMAAGLALVPVGAALSAALSPPLNPTPNRESKLIVGFETAVTAVSDPDGVGENRASVDSVLDYVAEGKSSLKLDLNGVNSWHDPYFAIDLRPGHHPRADQGRGRAVHQPGGRRRRRVLHRRLPAALRDCGWSR